MDAFAPALGQFLLQRAAREFQPPFVEKSDEFVRSRNPDHHRRCVSHTAETLFTFLECLLGRFGLDQGLLEDLENLRDWDSRNYHGPHDRSPSSERSVPPRAWHRQAVN